MRRTLCFPRTRKTSPGSACCFVRKCVIVCNIPKYVEKQKRDVQQFQVEGQDTPDKSFP